MCACCAVVLVDEELEEVWEWYVDGFVCVGCVQVFVSFIMVEIC